MRKPLHSAVVVSIIAFLANGAAAQQDPVPAGAPLPEPAASQTPGPAPGEKAAIEQLSLEALLSTPLEAATKTRIAQIDAPQSVTVLHREQIGRMPARSLAELLRFVVGANVVRIQSSQNVLGARGSNAFSPSKILILVDGQPIDPTLFSTTWWDLIPVTLEDVERIEFIRSPGTIYGANAQNGVVNIITRRLPPRDGATRHAASLTATSGDQRMRHGHAAYLGAFGGATLRLSASMDQLNAYENPQRLDIVPGRPSKPGEQVFADDKQMLDTRVFSGALSFKLGGGTLDTSVATRRVHEAQGRVPDRLCFVSLDGSLGFLNTRYAFEAGGFRHSLQAGHSRIEYQFLRNDDVVRMNVADMTLKNTRLSYEVQKDVRAHSLLVGFTYGLESADNGSGAPFLSGQRVSSERTITAHLQDEWRLGENDRLYLGGLFSHHYVSGAHFAPFAAFVHKLDASNVVRAGVFTSYRNPGVFEHSMDYDQVTGASGKLTRIVSNRNLEAERTVTWELGYRGSPTERLVLSVDGYRSDVRDAIEWTLAGVDTVPVRRPRYRSENTLSQTIYGVEAELRYRLFRHVTLDGGLVATDVENRSTRPEYQGPSGRGAREVGQGRYGSRYVPPRIYSAGLEIDPRPVRLAVMFQHTAAHTWQWPSWSSSSGRESLDLKPVPSYSLLNLHASVKLAGRVTLFFNGYNVLDKRHTEWRGDESYFGRSLWGGLGADF